MESTQDLPAGEVARVLSAYRARKYLVVPRDWDRRHRLCSVCQRWCVLAGWPFIFVERTWRRHARRGHLVRFKPTLNVTLKLPGSDWLSPEGHRAVHDYLRGAFWRPRQDVAAPSVQFYGPFTTTMNSEAHPCRYTQDCRARDLEAVAGGLFELARAHLTPQLFSTGVHGRDWLGPR